jgi:hypothetical protein
MGQILWDAVFDGQSLRMDNMFDMPVSARQIVETYGCFAFHSGLLAAGCPSPEDDHPLHGEFPCAPMRSASLLSQGTNPVALLPSHCPVNMSTT